jgi:membrane protease subunit HflK
MRAAGVPSEILRLAAPLLRGVDAAWRRMHWWIGSMALLYALSGITIIKPDEVAVILRWGRLVGETPAVQEHTSGLLFAFPKPIDTVVRVPVRHVYELDVDTLAPDGESAYTNSLDPLRQGYAISGDQNIVHARVVARYRIRDAAAWAFYGPRSEDVLRVEVAAAFVRSLGEMSIDRVLADGRQDLVTRAAARVQSGLDAAHAALELTSLELTRLSPPAALASDFTAVQSAFIAAETQRKDAQAYAASIVPQAQAQADTVLQNARGVAEADLARARGDAAGFTALAREYRANPRVVRERLYRNAVEQAISAAGTVRWIPPPGEGGKYHGLRITIPSTANARPPAVADDHQ